MSEYRTIKPNKKRKRKNPDKLSFKERILLTPDIIKVAVKRLKGEIK